MARIALTLLALAAFAPAASADTLIDQTSGANTATQSTSTIASGYDGETADDVVVPAGTQWTITEVDAQGFSYAGSASQVVNVRFYADAGGKPGTQEYAQATMLSTLGGSLTVPLATPAVLAPGTHWLSVQPIGSLQTDEWFWYGRSPVSGAPAYFQTGVGASCRTWTLRSMCQGGGAAPDQAFALKGTTGAAAATTPTPTPTVTATTTATPTASVYSVPTTTPTPTVTPAAASSAFMLKRVARKKRKFITYAVSVPNAGALTVKATAKRGKKTIKVARATVRPSAAGTVDVKLKLSKAARKALTHHTLRVKVRVTFAVDGIAPTTKTARVKLKRRG